MGGRTRTGSPIAPAATRMPLHVTCRVLLVGTASVPTDLPAWDDRTPVRDHVVKAGGRANIVVVVSLDEAVSGSASGFEMHYRMRGLPYRARGGLALDVRSTCS